ncbi:MAG: LOG family protein [Acidobacteriota bacterium]|nr:MAG: LOG family protein [Acidobacteriota bacterium]
MRYVAVFGSSEARPGDKNYDAACTVARRMAERGFGIVTGGYGGVMEAANRSAKEAGGRSLGITTQAFSAFPERRANPWLDEERCEPTLFARTQALVKTAAAYVIFSGAAGTLAEVAFLWALVRAGLLGEKPIVLVGQVWENVLVELERADFLTSREREASTVVRTAEEACAALEQGLSP